MIPDDQHHAPSCKFQDTVQQAGVIALPNRAGFTLLELIIVCAILATLAALAAPRYATYIGKAKTTRAIVEIRNLQTTISAFEIEHGRLPADLSDVNMGGLRDPWGNKYQYQSFANVSKGKWRKDKFLVPINSTYDLWSMGPDGESVPPLTSQKSHDDIIRANDGAFIGKAAQY